VDPPPQTKTTINIRYICIDMLCSSRFTTATIAKVVVDLDHGGGDLDEGGG